MSDKMDVQTTAAALQDAYLAASVEFNLAAAPLTLAMAAQLRPSEAEVAREENARATVVAARGKVWASYGRR